MVPVTNQIGFQHVSTCFNHPFAGGGAPSIGLVPGSLSRERSETSSPPADALVAPCLEPELGFDAYLMVI